MLNRSEDSVEKKLRGSKVEELKKTALKPKSLIKKLFSVLSHPKDTIKTVWLFDSHFPHNLPVEPIIKYCKDIKVDIFGFGGDNWSLDVISHWNTQGFKNVGFDNVMKAFNDEAERFKNHIGKIVDSLPDTKFVYILGNHEDWLEQFSAEFPQTKKPTIQSILGEYASRIEFIPRGGFYQIGKLFFAHGDQFGSANPAKQAVERTNKTIVFGHHHVYKVWPQFSMVDERDKHLGIAVPCYCGVAPAYGKGRPNQWMNGFFSACVKKSSGNFTPYIVPVNPQGHFMDMTGKEYT